MKNSYSYIGFIAALLTTFASVPQMIRVLRLKESRDISLWTTFMLCTGTALWLVHGIIIKDPPIIAANSVSLVLTLTMVFLVIRYR